jgi:hypothetical protein
MALEVGQEAMRAFALAWRAWLVEAGLVEPAAPGEG